jgi:RNA polymerase sigma-70 factor (ECF subfamily)
MVMADSGEFDDFYRRESQGVLVFFSRRTLDPELALDLTAETFARSYT